MDEFETVCNWISDNDKKLDCVIVCSSEKKGIESVNAETCVCLIQRITDDIAPQKPELEIKSKLPIKELNIYSEASLIEVFGLHNEYLSTCKAEFIDDWEGLAVYHAIIELAGITACTLKFTRTREKDRLWIYSIQPTTIKSALPNHRFNFQNFINLISSSPQISEKTEEVKKVVEHQLKSSTSGAPLSFQALINAINQECNFKFQDCKKSLSKSLNGSGYLCSIENCTKTNTFKNKIYNEYVMNYIDRKFIEMKAELMNQMEINLAQLRNENNAKLDKIMNLIKNANI